MEAYVTRTEFESVLKELRRLRFFLEETFGNKFTDFQSERKDEGEDPQPGVVVVVGGARRTSSTSHGMLSGKSRVDSVSDGGGGGGSRNYISRTDHIVEFDPLKIADREPSTPIVTSTRSLFQPLSVPSCGISGSSGGRVSPIPPVVLSEPRSPSSSAVLVGAKPNNNRLKRLNVGPRRVSKAHEPICAPRPPSDFVVESSTCFNKTNVNSPLVPSNVDTENGIPSKRVCKNPLPSSRKRREPLGMKESRRTSSSQPPSSPPEVIQCRHCQLFIYSSQLDEHMKNHSVLDAKNQQQYDKGIFKQPQICPVCMLKCDDFQYYEDHFRKQHVNVNNEIPCPICRKTMHLSVQLRGHMITHKIQRFTCDVCGKCYNRKDNLNAHSKLHSNATDEPTVFYCGSCRNIAFSSREGRDRHMKMAHSNPSDIPIGSGKLASITKSAISTETINCGNGTANLMEFVYEGEDEEDVELD